MAGRGGSSWRTWESEFLREGWEEGTEEVIHFYTLHLDEKRLVTQQVVGFMVIDGVRHHARRLLVTKGMTERLAKMVYNYIALVDKR